MTVRMTWDFMRVHHINILAYVVSDSEEEAARPTNRGYKLKRKAEHFHEGELGGARPYKKVPFVCSPDNIPLTFELEG